MAPPSDDHDCGWKQHAEGLSAKLDAVLSELQALKRQVHGKKSERSKSSKMPAPVVEAKTPEQTTNTRAAARQQRLAAMQTVITPVAVPPARCICPKCGSTDLKVVGEGKTSVVIEHVAAHFRRHAFQRETRACSCGEYIVTAPAPDRVGEGTRYAPSFVAHLVVSKCADAGAQHRLEKAYARCGVPIPRSTMNDLFHRAADELRPLWQRMRARVAKASHVCADETSIVLQGQQSKAFVWTFVSGEMIVYEFASSRSGETAVKVLGNSTGSLQCDAYTGYNQVTKPGRRTRAGCFAHVRRKFYEAREVPEAAKAVELIRALYVVEHEAKAAGIVGTPDHLALRNEKSRDTYIELLLLARGIRRANAPRTKMAKAARYLLSNIFELGRFLRDPMVALDNNKAEASLRRVALGRKNFLFVGSEQAGKNLAVLYSLVATCEMHKVNPLDYLADVLARIDKHPHTAIDELLPDRWKPPEGG